MSELLPNYVHGEWVRGEGPGVTLSDPMTGAEVARISSLGLDLGKAFDFARETGGAALRALSYGERSALLAAIGRVLQANREAYFEIATANSGTTKADGALDIDGAIYTVGYFAKLGAALGEARTMADGAATSLAKDGAFQSQHILAPTRGLALFINAYNFPAWGLWEKAAPALLSGVPVIVKPASPTAWLTQRMVADVVEAGVLPAGALSVICGGSAGLLDPLGPLDVLSFTGSAATAKVIRSHAAVTSRAVRVNIEADSLNSALLLPDSGPQSEGFGLLIREAVREITQKSGQKCTAIRRILVPRTAYAAAAEAIAARLAGVTVGDPRNESVRMGALVNREQLDTVRQGLAALRAQTRVVHDGAAHPLADADPAVAACIGPTLLAADDPQAASSVHEIEVFGPAATIMPYDDLAEAAQLVARGEGSLVASLYGSGDAALAADAVARLAGWHGRLHVVNPDAAAAQTGHGNAMPQSIHGGPGRAGGGEELGGLRALGFYHRRCAVQAGPDVLAALGGAVASLPG